MNNTNKTASILQRLPVILAVTAASYGLPAQSQSQRCAAAPAANPLGTSHQAQAGQSPR